MDIFFQDPTAIPLPPKEVRIKELRAEPWPDNRRVNIYLEVSPFQKRPNAEVNIINPQGGKSASASIIETMNPRMELTLHLRGENLPGEYHVSALLFYEHEPQEGETPPVEREKMIVDEAVAIFLIGE